MTEGQACANGCRLRRGDPNEPRPPVRCEPPSRQCSRCEQRLARYLRNIPDRYAVLPRMVELGSVSDRNPDSKVTKRPDPPAPLRLAAVDLLDNRRGRRHGEALAAMLEAGHDPKTAGTPDSWRGVIGLLHSWANIVREKRNIEIPWDLADDGALVQRVTVTGEAAFLLRHSLWIGEQEWVSEFYREIKRLDSDLADAVAEWRARQVAKCHNEVNGRRCRGPIYPSDDGGVHCPRCGRVWSEDQLRHLGLVQHAIQDEETTP